MSRPGHLVKEEPISGHVDGCSPATAAAAVLLVQQYRGRVEADLGLAGGAKLAGLAIIPERRGKMFVPRFRWRVSSEVADLARLG